MPGILFFKHSSWSFRRETSPWSSLAALSCRAHLTQFYPEQVFHFLSAELKPGSRPQNSRAVYYQEGTVVGQTLPNVDPLRQASRFMASISSRMAADTERFLKPKILRLPRRMGSSFTVQVGGKVDSVVEERGRKTLYMPNIFGNTIKSWITFFFFQNVSK